jgi:hypothetical protein
MIDKEYFKVFPGVTRQAADGRDDRDTVAASLCPSRFPEAKDLSPVAFRRL